MHLPVYAVFSFLNFFVTRDTLLVSRKYLLGLAFQVKDVVIDIKKLPFIAEVYLVPVLFVHVPQ